MNSHQLPHQAQTKAQAQTQAQAHAFAGQIQALYDTLLIGWAWDRQNPDQRLSVEIYLDGACVAVAFADQYQIHTPEGDGFHGFSVQLAQGWVEQAQRIAVRIANHDHWLDGTLQLKPSQVRATDGESAAGEQTATRCRSAAPALLPSASQIWYTGGLSITGWVWDPRDPERTLHVSARLGERIIARAHAKRPHPAFSAQTPYAHGFVLELPWELADGQQHTLHLETETGAALQGSPLRVCLRPEGLEAWLSLICSPETGVAPQPASLAAPAHNRQLPADVAVGGQAATDDGGKASGPSAPSSPSALALLRDFIRDQDLRAPRTLGWQHYARWFACWPTHALPAPHGVPLALGVLILQPADTVQRASPDAGVARTQASLHQQTQPPQWGLQCPPHKLHKALGYLLELGAQAVLLIEAGDHLHPQALEALSLALQNPLAGGTCPAWVYSDCDHDGPNGERCHPWFKPVWDPDLFLGADLFSPGALFSAATLRAALQLWSAQTGDARGSRPATPPPPCTPPSLLAAIAWVTEQAGQTVAHLPLMLYHRHAGQPHTPARAEAQPEREAAVRWLAQHWAPGSHVTPLEGYPALYRVRYPLPDPAPKVSLIIPTRDRLDLLQPCMEGLLRRTRYPNLELMVVDNESVCPDTLAYFKQLQNHGVRILRYPHPFNYAAINNAAVAQASGTLIGLLNNDIEVRDPDWLREMVSQACRPGVGAVGAKLLWRNGMVQHAGAVVGVNGLAAHIGNTWLNPEAGYLGLNQLARRQSAVTAACLLMSKMLYLELGGLDAVHFPVAFNDVDLCLRLRQRGHSLIWTPFAQLIHAESASRGKDQQADQAARARREHQYFLRFWQNPPWQDPYYHPHLNQDWSHGPYAGLSVAQPQFRRRVADSPEQLKAIARNNYTN